MPARHKVFVSYFDAEDRVYKTAFEKLFQNVIVSRSVVVGEIEPNSTVEYVHQKTCDKLLSLLDETEDSTSEYMSEIVKLENENLGRVGYKYPNWKKKTSFNWTDARKYLGLGESK